MISIHLTFSPIVAGTLIIPFCAILRHLANRLVPLESLPFQLFLLDLTVLILELFESQGDTLVVLR
jgi:hypothetical protein